MQVQPAGAPEGIRTPGFFLRREALYPAELQAQIFFFQRYFLYHIHSQSFRQAPAGNFSFFRYPIYRRKHNETAPR